MRGACGYAGEVQIVVEWGGMKGGMGEVEAPDDDPSLKNTL